MVGDLITFRTDGSVFGYMPRKWPITFLNSALKRYTELCQVFIFNVPRLGHIIKFTEKKQAYDNEISAVNWGC